MRHRRRTTRKLEDLPSLFGEEEIYGGALSEPTSIVSDNSPSGGIEYAEAELRLGEEFKKPRHRLRFISFGSGSSGNCAYVGTPDCGILIDAGIDNNFVISELHRNGIDLKSIHGVLLTHDHGDHVRYIYALVRRQPGWRIFATPRTIEGILRRHNISRRIRDYHSPIYKEHEYTFGDIKVVPFATSHDGTDNVGFSFTMGNTSLVICTDTGIITERADHYLQQATAIMIESNYDENMLVNGRYREYLKARIRSEIGHLDNAETARYISAIYKPSLKHIFLCHLSEENNLPEIAINAMTEALSAIKVACAGSPADISDGQVFLTALPRFRSSELFVL